MGSRQAVHPRPRFQRPRLDPGARRVYGARRLVVAGVVFAAAIATALSAGATVGVAVAAAWGTAALATVLWVRLRLGRWAAADTARHARAEDYSRPTADALLLSASVCSLVPVGYTLLSAGRHHGAEKALLILLATAVVVLSWAPRAHGVRAALWRSLLRLTPGRDRLQRDRSARLSRLCLRRAYAWHDLSGVGHELNQQGVGADGHAARADVVPLRLRDR